jgi:hypothetical protein
MKPFDELRKAIEALQTGILAELRRLRQRREGD